MPKTTMIHARVPIALKEDVTKILKELGLSATEAITLFYSQVKLRKGLPFPVQIPNEETLKALKEVEEGKTVDFDNLDDFFADLKK